MVITAVTNNLNSAISVLSDNEEPETYINLDKEVDILKTESNSNQRNVGRKYGRRKYLLKMQEFQLVIEQLIWLTSLSESILKSSTNISFSNYSNFKVLSFFTYRIAEAAHENAQRHRQLSCHGRFYG
jgi:hypothetical protein